MKSLKCLLLFLALAVCAQAQSAPTLPSTVPYEDHGVFSLDLQNLTVPINLPIREKSGPQKFSATYNGVANQFSALGGPSYLGAQANNLAVNGLVGNQVTVWYSTRVDTGVKCLGSNVFNKVNLTGWYLRTADGSQHPLPATIAMDENYCTHSSFASQITTDGSGYTVSYDMKNGTASVISANGDTTGTVTFVPGFPAYNFFQVTDSNGNKISANTAFTAYTDTLATTALTSTGGQTTPTYSWTDAIGNTQNIVFTTTTQNRVQNYGCGWDTTTLNVKFLTKVAYPDGSSVKFSYEQIAGGTTGRLASITERTGGVVSFTYSGINCRLAATGPNGPVQDGYTLPSTMHMTIDGHTWTYVVVPITTQSGTYNYLSGNTTTVTDPSGNVAVYTFGGSQIVGFYLNHIVRNQGPSTVLSDTTVTQYPINVPPFTTISTSTKLGTMTSANLIDATYDAYGNVTSTGYSDYGGTSSIYNTNITYTGCGSGANVVDKPCDSQKSQGVGVRRVIIAEIKYTYSPSGNPLTSSVWTGSTWLTTTKTFNANGTVATATAPDGVFTTYNYATGASCNGGFPTSTVVNGTTLSSTWNCDGGVPVDVIDGNLVRIQHYGYTNAAGTAADPFWRRGSETDALGNVTYAIYTPNSVETKSTFGSSVQDAISTVDGYGRNKLKQTAQNGSYNTVSTSYGFNATGATVTTSVPCSAVLGAACTTGFSTATYDGVGRLASSVDGASGTVSKTYTLQDVLTTVGPHPAGELVKQFQREYNGLGMLTATCNVLSSGGNLCGQASGTSSGVSTAIMYGFGSGTTTVTSVRGAQTRVNVTDALGRTTSRTDPERTGAVVTLYDSAADCSGTTFNGHVTEVIKPDGFHICYYYDSFGRLSSYDSNNYPQECVNFFYDNSTGRTGTIPTGVTPTNPIGRMVEASTGCTISPVTDLWFGYSPRGELTDLWELTPSSGGYYHTTATYFPNGKVSSLGGIPGYPTYSFGINSDGVLNQASTGTTLLVGGVTYGPTGVTNVDIGSGTDADTYVYDTATGRMKSYQFFVGSGSSKGTLSWNADGQLGGLNITDTFNAGGSQNNVYVYDDIGRLVSDTAATWSQTFSFDVYNNLTKGGMSAWAPGYFASNNHYNNGATYDANGNVLTDGTGTSYKWLESGKLGVINPSVNGFCGAGISLCFTYDALGRMVEKVNMATGVTTEMLYSPLGKTAEMSGGTVNHAYIPMPGGGTLYVAGATGNTRAYQHPDWLGTMRVQSSIPATGNGVVGYDRAFAPYGEIEAANSFGPAAPFANFTGDTQDITVGLSDTPARELNNGQGRWISPDPAGAGWNLYAYGTDPNRGTDPSGLQMCCWGGNLGSASSSAGLDNAVPYQLGVVTSDSNAPPSSPIGSAGSGGGPPGSGNYLGIGSGSFPGGPPRTNDAWASLQINNSSNAGIFLNRLFHLYEWTQHDADIGNLGDNKVIQLGMGPIAGAAGPGGEIDAIEFYEKLSEWGDLYGAGGARNGDVMGNHFVTRLFIWWQDAEENAALSEHAGAALNLWMKGSQSIQEIILGDRVLKEGILDIGQERFNTGIEFRFSADWYKNFGLFWSR